jgi:septal ring factor EnvC (AmiA/AmiB activator)
VNSVVENSVPNTPTAQQPFLPEEAKEPSSDVGVSASDATLELAGELIKTLSSASKEAAILAKSLSDTNGTIALFRKDIANRDSQIAELSSTISMRERTIEELERKLNGERQTVREKDDRISDLSERLKNSLQMDNISQNQELITLKANLQNSLKVEYSDYLASKEVECNPDTYGALLGSLARIFRTLRRYGVIID